MKTVGIRELKNRLSAYLRAVSSGETVVVTDRGRVIAELAPAQKHSIEAGLAGLARQGILTKAVTKAKSYPELPRALTGQSGKELLDLERGSH